MIRNDRFYSAYRFGGPARRFWCDRMNIHRDTAFVDVARCVIAAYPRLIWEGPLPSTKNVAAQFLDYAQKVVERRPEMLDRTPLPARMRRAA